MPAQTPAAARSLRRRATDAERKLWRSMRNRQLAGAKFRRQHPLGTCIVDFVCLEQALVVEVDGGGHALQAGTDRERDSKLEREGYRVLRFWNHDVLTRTTRVLQAIEEALQPPHLNPLPHGERRPGRKLRANAASSPLAKETMAR